ncbi:protein FAR1-RELATED SEQUENCE 11-like, partial [Trifolium medium]|nr:protein FAR1-RELATED SEQUENCE 11-like [Trifolium medium]
AFLGFMKGKAPQTILTDHNTWLKDAIAVEMPESKHAFCIWHILSKFSNWFSILLGSQYDEWKAEFHRLYNLEMVDDFEEGWRLMVADIVDFNDRAGAKQKMQRKMQKVCLKTGQTPLSD